jgi:hypothetical protein
MKDKILARFPTCQEAHNFLRENPNFYYDYYTRVNGEYLIMEQTSLHAACAKFDAIQALLKDDATFIREISKALLGDDFDQCTRMEVLEHAMTNKCAVNYTQGWLDNVVVEKDTFSGEFTVTDLTTRKGE